MIFVQPQPEPPDFDVKVRQPGKKCLSNYPAKRLQSYWSRITPDLWKAYGGVCAYSCHWFPQWSGESVDHFIPKAVRPDLAYEWSNYRLATQKLNSLKGEATDLVDPFAISGDWFELVFPAMLVRPNPQLIGALSRQVQNTINVLKLNHEAMVNIRLGYVLQYCDGEITLAALRKLAPFIAHELVRQHLTVKICSMMKRRSLN